jgi:sortase (surface protein transpeptidase)
MRRSALLALVTLLVLPCAPSPAVAATHASPVASKSDALVFVGRISIPRLKVSTTIYKGVTDLQFDRGVGLIKRHQKHPNFKYETVMLQIFTISLYGHNGSR